MKLSEIVKQTILTEGYLNPPTGKGELALYNDAAQLGARVAKLEQALEFYAADITYTGYSVRSACDCCSDWECPIDLDEGARAREALKEIE